MLIRTLFHCLKKKKRVVLISVFKKKWFYIQYWRKAGMPILNRPLFFFICCRHVMRKCQSLSSCMGAIIHPQDMFCFTSLELVRQFLRSLWAVTSKVDEIWSKLMAFSLSLAPEYMLCLQNGKFDHADRTFNRFVYILSTRSLGLFSNMHQGSAKL